MRYLLDTSVVSEMVKATPHRGVVAWTNAQPFDTIHLSVVTLIELRFGIDRLPPGKRREGLARWLDVEIPVQFEGRIVELDSAVADAVGRLWAQAVGAGRTPDLVDVVLAATVKCFDLALATRNVRDFDIYGVRVVDPWSAA
ncbi:MAG: PIN domain-containing protein [Alphaproteobacteria bacterium]|nr:PIN domain-containing protein [Alphaproteobacteria bacterium]MCW5743465.1 PIN domain-containing protein [Alphaproteobacteria bacterium]